MGTSVSVDVRVEGISNVEQIRIRKEKIFKDLNEAIDKIKQIRNLRTKNGEWNKDLLKSLSVFFKTYDSIKEIGPLTYDVIRKYRCEAGQQLSESKSISVICKVIMECLKMGYIDKEGKTGTHQFEVITQSLLTLMNYSDCTPEVTYDIAGEPNFLETIKGILSTILPTHMEGKAKEEEEKVMKWCLTIYYNTSIVDYNIPRLRRLDIVPVFSSFLDAKVEIYQLSALATLANIIDEKESTEILKDNSNIIEFLSKKLGLAVTASDHRHLGWSAEECAGTVRRLARNDANKKLLVEKGCLPHLFKLVKVGNMEEQREAVRAIHVLAFEKENLSSILDDTEIIDLLQEIKENSSDNQLRKAADGTLWCLREELRKKKDKHTESSLEQKKDPAKESPGTPVKDGRGHIMISYDWSYQKELVKIRDILKEHGYAVWMDIDNMSGSTMQAMAEAVEHADVILICMSHKYKDSPNCRAEAEYAFTWRKEIVPMKMESGYNPNVWLGFLAGSRLFFLLQKKVENEAEYAFQLKKKIVPLKMEKGYQPDGWLGFFIGAKLFFDFSGKYPFEEKIAGLIREIAICYGDEDAKPKVVPIKS